MVRFHSKYISVKNKGKPNPNKLPSNQEEIHLIEAYIVPCIYSNSENKKRENLIIKFRFKEDEDIVSLNILLEDYKDLL
jgi:hypothetical protein